MKYKITNINHDRSFVEFTVTFADASTYDKRMMVSTTFNDKQISYEIKKWLKSYLPVREKPTVPAKVTALLNKDVTVTQAQLDSLEVATEEVVANPA